jgi:uncharacterized protein (TIGR02646 family)
VRTIRKRPAPNALTEWRRPRLVTNRPEGMQCSYEEMRRTSAVLEAVEDSLFAEQGCLCAYTGQRIDLTSADSATGIQRAVGFHIEHLTPQAHCAYGQDADYSNFVACWPRPTCGFEPAYGARKKGSWPSPDEQAHFVSPLRADCSARFRFNHRGEIDATEASDTAANETMNRLGLKHPELTALRRAAIQGALHPASHPIKLIEARKLMQRMKQDANDVDQGILTPLVPFFFAIQPAIEREIRKLEAILNQR